MSNLLAAQFKRLFRSKIFYAIIIIAFVMALLFTMPNCTMYLQEFDYYSTRSLEDSIMNSTFAGPMRPELTEPFIDIMFEPDFYESFNTIYLDSDYYMNASYMVIGVVAALMISLLIGTEFSSGTIRNKLIAGHSRASVYLSNLIVCIASEIIINAIYIIGTLIPSLIIFIRYQGRGQKLKFMFSFKEQLMFQVIGLGIITFYAALFLFITMIASSRSRAAAASLLAMVILFVMGLLTNQKLYSFEYRIYSSDSYSSGINYTNPYYDAFDDYETYSEFKDKYKGYELTNNIEKKFYILLDSILPTCQANFMSDSDEIPPRANTYLAFDFGFSAVLTAFGIVIFNRKELK